MEPKIGDKIICVVNHNRSIGSKTDSGGYGAGWVEGNIYTIKNIDRNLGKAYVYWFNEAVDGVFADCVKVVPK